jgi:hypothetical protein
MPRRSRIGCLRGFGDVAGPQCPPPRLERHRQGHRSPFPRRFPPGVGHGCARRLSVRASLAVRPPPPRVRGCGATGGARLAQEARRGLLKKDNLTRGPH